VFSRREFFADEDEEMAKRLITMVAMTESVQFVLSVKLLNAAVLQQTFVSSLIFLLQTLEIWNDCPTI